MSKEKNKIAPMPRIFNIYIPKKYRQNAIVNMGGLQLDTIKALAPEKYNKLLQSFKDSSPNMIFVDIYKNNIIFFDCLKAIKEIKKISYKKHGFHILIKKVIVADIDQIQASDENNELFEPCHTFEQYTDYPAIYTFDTPI